MGIETENKKWMYVYGPDSFTPYGVSLYTCVCVCVCVCLSLYISIHLPKFFISLLLSLSVSLYLSLSVSLRLSLSFSLHRSVSLLLSFSLSLSLSLSLSFSVLSNKLGDASCLSILFLNPVSKQHHMSRVLTNDYSLLLSLHYHPLPYLD